jgi:hypothetical protein
VFAFSQSTVCRHDDKEHVRHVLTLLEQRVDRGVQLIFQAGNDFRQLVGEGSRVENILLRATQLGRCHHFHGACHLLGVFHRGDAAA